MTKKPASVAVIVALLVAILSLAACTLQQNPTHGNTSPTFVTPSPPEISEPHGQAPVAPPPATEGQGMAVYVFDVGEALSVLIDDEDTEVLIDAGNDRDGSVIAGKVAPHIADGTIEYVIATHSHADHIGGMEDIYAAYQVAHTIYGDTGTSKQFGEFMDAAQGEPNSAVKEDEDEVIPLADGATLTVLDILDGAPNTNNNSVVTVLEADGHRMLVTGDAEDEKSKEVQTALVERLQREQLYPINV